MQCRWSRRQQVRCVHCTVDARVDGQMVSDRRSGQLLWLCNSFEIVAQLQATKVDGSLPYDNATDDHCRLQTTRTSPLVNGCANCPAERNTTFCKYKYDKSTINICHELYLWYLAWRQEKDIVFQLSECENEDTCSGKSFRWGWYP